MRPDLSGGYVDCRSAEWGLRVEGTMSGCPPDHLAAGRLITQAGPCSGGGWAVRELEAGSAVHLIWDLSTNVCLVMETLILKTGGVWVFAYSRKWIVWGPQCISGSKVSARCGFGAPLRMRPAWASVLKGAPWGSTRIWGCRWVADLASQWRAGEKNEGRWSKQQASWKHMGERKLQLTC